MLALQTWGEELVTFLVDNAELIGALAGLIAIIGAGTAALKWGGAIFSSVRNRALQQNRPGPAHKTMVENKLAVKRQLQKVFPAGSKPDVIIHSIDDDSYPKVDEAPEGRISSWFKVEFCDHYHNGVEVYLRVEKVIFDDDGNWAIVDEYGAEVDGDIYDSRNVFVIGRIPFRNIVEIDDLGDEYYGSAPHLYCKFADQGMPYEDIVYRPTGEGYQPTLNPGQRFAFKDRRAQ